MIICIVYKAIPCKWTVWNEELYIILVQLCAKRKDDFNVKISLTPLQDKTYTVIFVR